MSGETDAGGTGATTDAPPQAQRAEGRTGAKSDVPEDSENSIQASRRRRNHRARPAAAEQPTVPPGPRASNFPPGLRPGSQSTTDSDPWTVPASVRDRFVQDGNRFYFPDGAAAFRDLGRKLVTTSENTEVVHSLIEIAQARGWSEIKVAGTDRFRQEAWQQARLAGLGVRGYQPTNEEQARVVRTLARSLGRSTRPEDDGRAEPAAPPQQAPAVASGIDSVARSRSPAGADRLAGTLLRHGRARYRHDAREDFSYFVRVKTPQGEREIWGRDIERALEKSLTQPRVGDEIVLQRSARDAVTVRRPEREENGIVTHRPVAVFRTRWVIEKRAFFDERAAAAKIVRNEAVRPADAVRADPKLANTYLGIRAAELVAEKALQRVEDRRRFVSKVREALAWGVERGEPSPSVKLRVPRPERPRSERPPSRAPDPPEYAR